MKLEKMTFEEIYLIYFNEFLTIDKMAEYYKVNKELLAYWIDCGRTANNSKAENWEELQEYINNLYLNII
jgi:hypothetical protein